MASERAPSSAEVLRRAIEAALADVHKAIPAAVTRWDPKKQQVDCKPLVQLPYLDEPGDRQVESVPVIPGVPLVFPGGAGIRLTFPISDGSLVLAGKKIKATTGTLFFMDRSIDKWLTGDGGEVDPEIDHIHALPDAIFIPGLNPFGAPLGDVPTDHATIGFDNGLQIHLRDQTITIGDEQGSDFLARAQKVLDELNHLKTHFTAVEAVLTGAKINEPGNGAPSALQVALKAAVQASPYPTPGSMATSQAKGQ